MKYILLIMLFNGGVNSVEFGSERACLSASIALDLKAAGTILTEQDYRPHIAAVCVVKGGE